MKYKKLIKKAIDLHVHIGPEIIPRKFTLQSLVEYESGKIGGFAVKNHFFPTSGMAEGNRYADSPVIIRSVVLNNYVGGFNPEIIDAATNLSERPIIVWFPTINAANFLKRRKFEIPEEWISPDSRFKISRRPARLVKKLNVLDEMGRIKKEVVAVLASIKKNDAILATGHISWRESEKLVEFAAKRIGLRKIIITHPIYQEIDMSIEIQKKLAKLGAVIEHCFSMYSIDKIPIKKIADQIKQVGPKNCILSSDVGQAFSPSPSESLEEFIVLLIKEGVSIEDAEIMLVANPSNLINKG